MAEPQPAADHAIYPHWPLPGRPRLVWPNGARLAVCFNLYFETMAYDPPPGSPRDPRWRDRFERDWRVHSWYEYGNRVGIFRILALLDRHRIRATVAANAEACERFPSLVENFSSRGYEISAHGFSANRMIAGEMPEAEERAAFTEAIARVETATGTRPRGWFSQDYAASARAPRLLSGLGIEYLADWPNDEQPYLLNTAAPLVSIPNYSEWDDVRLLWDRRLQMPRYPAIVGEAFDRLYRDAAGSGRFFSLNIHPWVLGAAHRIRYLEQVVDKIAATPDIWIATAADVARHIAGGATRA